MFRTAALRASRAAALRPISAATVAARANPSSSPLTMMRAARPSFPMTRVTLVFSVRCYSAGGSLDKEAVEGRIMSLLQGFDKVNDAANINPTAHFANDLGLDSLDTVEVVMAIEEEFSIEIPDKDADKIHSIGQATEYLLSRPDAC